MSITPISTVQAQKIFKAIIYAFGAGFIGSFTLQATDVLKAVHDGRSALTQLLTSVLTGGVVAGINGVAFAVEKLLETEPSK